MGNGSRCAGVKSRDILRNTQFATGLLLAVIGGACVVLGLALKVGQFAVGTFVGGVLCIWLGLFAGVAGWVARTMLRRAKPKG